MKEGEITLMDLEFEYKMWKNHIDWFLQDLKIVRERNDELKRGLSREGLNEVEEMILEEYESQLERMQKRIQTQEREMQYYNKDFPVTPNHQYVVEHLDLRRQMEKLSGEVIDKISDLIKELSF
ncbi:hypothetical protein [Thermophagus xiamenensis]|uniref:Uncharacterized protein n=1 Tax=Thermophagus xiamenensis TaxID=385682 RepID=A0A1I1XJU1_9BACT|nr:hypothetical protein [Thermophagus xiamenensis]SFE07659.1 hypothetical protein SAMN05444380_10670 [Thermophagus xiamenensis]